MVIDKRNIKIKTDYFNTEDLHVDLKKRAVRSGGISIISQSTSYLIQIISTLIMVRILIPHDFGLVAMVSAIIAPLTIFADMGLIDATVQEPNIDHNQVSTLFWINLTACLGVVLLLFLFSPIIAKFYKENVIKWIMIVSSSSILITGLSAQHIALLKRRMKFLEIEILRVLARLTCNVSAIVFALLGYGFWALVSRDIIFAIFFAIGTWVICKWRPGKPSYRSNIKPLLLLGGNITISYIVGYFTRSVDKILVGRRFGPAQLGFYEKAFWLSELPSSQLSTAISNVAISTLSKVRNEPAKFQHYFLKLISIISFVAMPLSFYFVIESKNIILFALGAQWEQSIIIFKILALTAGFRVLYSTLYWLHISQGRAERLTRWVVISTIITCSAYIIGSAFGVKGVAISYITSLVLLTPIGLKYAGMPIGIKLRFIIKSSWKTFLAAVLTGFVCLHIFGFLFITINRPLRFMFTSILFLIIYLLFVTIIYRNFQPILDIKVIVYEIFSKNYNK